MESLPLLGELTLIAVLGVVVTAVLARLKLPTVAGLLAAGALAGPYGLGLVREVHAIEQLAEVGVVLLLFTIGLEFSLARLRHIFKRVAFGGLVQVLATIGAGAGVALAFGEPPARAVLIGFVLALSSTAIVMRALSDRGELDAPHGRFIVGTLIFQDLCVVPMVLLVPVLASHGAAVEAFGTIGLALAKAAGVVAGALLVARFVVPRLLRFIVASRSRELFLLAVLAICVGTALLTSLVGLSLALGAFLGGMVVADTEFQHRALGDIIPLRDAFVSVFFLSLGMLFDGRLLLTEPLLLAGLVAAFVLGKGALATAAAVVMRFPARAAWLAGIGLAQFSEFGYVLLRLAEKSGLGDSHTTRRFLAAGVISMFLTPLLIRLAPRITAGEKILGPLTRLLGVRGVEDCAGDAPTGLRDHVVVIGYGVAGRLVVRALQTCNRAHIVLELNAETVRRARAAGEPVYYADATSPEALGHAHAADARVVVILINDPLAALRVVDTLKRVAPAVPVLIRSRYLLERPRLLTLGAADVVVEEVEASVEMLSRVLRRLEVPVNVIDQQIREARDELQTSTRRIRVPRPALPDHEALADLQIESLLLTPAAPAIGQTARTLALRTQTHALIVAVRRGPVLLDHPNPDEPFQPGDILYLAGAAPALRAAQAAILGASGER